MNAELRVASQDDGTHISFLGEWDLSAAPRLREALDSVNAAGHVVFDCSELTYLDSSIMRVLVEFKKRSTSQQGSTAIYYGDNEKVRNMMSISGIGPLF